MGDFYVTYTLSPSLTHPFLAPLILCPYRTVVHPNFLLICSQFPLTDPPLFLLPLLLSLVAHEPEGLEVWITRHV